MENGLLELRLWNRPCTQRHVLPCSAPKTWAINSDESPAACHAVQGPRDLKFFLASNAGPANENSLLGVPDEVNTGESIGSGEKVNVCKFDLGNVNNWNVSSSGPHSLRSWVSYHRLNVCDRLALGRFCCSCAQSISTQLTCKVCTITAFVRAAVGVRAATGLSTADTVRSFISKRLFIWRPAAIWSIRLSAAEAGHVAPNRGGAAHSERHPTLVQPLS
jgi:hypothetical protein